MDLLARVVRIKENYKTSQRVGGVG